VTELRRLVMLRHGETEGNSSVRFHGSGDVPLSDEGRAHMRRAAHALATEWFDLVVASPLRRSWEGARIVAGGAPLRVEEGFREVDFGRWEGLTAEEIQRSDPVLYNDWQERAPGFEFPDGELRAHFTERVERGLERVLESGAKSALLVLHKGPIRTIAAKLLGEELPKGEPGLGEFVDLYRNADGHWHRGRPSSDPPALAAG
jgi:broad specificity phosphatase PhoE